jgi:hypothetical protein
MPSPQATAAPDASALITQQQSDADYRNAPGLSQSEARELLRSAAHWQARYGPDAEPLQPTRAMLFGQAFHYRILEPADFCRRYADREDLEVNLNLSELKALAAARGLQVSSKWRKAELEACLWPQGRPVDPRIGLDREELVRIEAMAACLLGHPLTGTWFNPEQPQYRRHNELVIQGTSAGGLQLKGRLDRVLSAAPEEIARMAANLHLDLQASWYRHLATQAFPSSDTIEVVLVAIEKQPPHAIGLYRVSEAMLANGDKKRALAIDRFCAAQASGTWPAYPAQIQTLQLPAWAQWHSQA